MTIEVGEFVRNNKGNIGKIIGIFNGHCNAKYHIEFQGNVKIKRQYLSTKTILKHSKQIIDLIEEGDYVNGYKIIMNLQKSKKHYNTENNFVTAVGYTFAEEEIKTILTHEQFERNAFRLEE